MKKLRTLSGQLTREELHFIQGGGQPYMQQFCSGWCIDDMNCRNIAGAACRCHPYGCKWG